MYITKNNVVPDTEENVKRCLCPGCSTYNLCMKNNKDTLFCSRGKTECNFKNKGCPCSGCLVWAEYRLDEFYYCERGAAKR